MLSKLVIRLYSALLEIGLWMFLLFGLIGGWNAGGFLGAIGGVIVSAITGAIIFGAFLVIDDIRKKVNAIEQKNQSDA